jgi:hypothetical protein
MRRIGHEQEHAIRRELTVRLTAVTALVLLVVPPVLRGGLGRRLTAFDWLVPPRRVHVFAVGINDYPSKALNLAGSANDAEALKALFSPSRLSGVEADVEVLTNERATKEGIRAVFQRLAKTAGPDDLFIFSFSGHSITLQGKASVKEVYFLPADVAVNASCDSNLSSVDCLDQQSILSGSLLYSWMTQIHSRRQILLFDSSNTDLMIPVFESHWRREACSVGPEEMKRILLLTNHDYGMEVVAEKAVGLLTLAARNALRGISPSALADLLEHARSPVNENEGPVGGDRTAPLTAAGVQQAIYRESIVLNNQGWENRFRADLLGGDFVVAGPPGRPALPEEVVLDSGLGPVCYDGTEASRGFAQPGEATSEQATEKSPPKNYALVVATDNYRSWSHLSNPIFDATTIETHLKKIYGFQVDHLFDPTRQELQTKLNELHQRRFGNDQLFIFIAGHGDYDATNEIGYLVFKDAPAGHDYDSDMNLLDLRRRIDTIPASHILLVMDSCFAGGLDPDISGSGSRGEYDPIPLAELVKRSANKETRYFLTSGSKEYVPDGQPGHHSPFAALFIYALENKGGKDGYLSLANLPPYFQRLTTTAHMGNLGHNETGSEFFFIPLPGSH